MPENERGIQHIFVYGSLRRVFGHPESEILAQNGTYLGEAYYSGELYEIEWYPGVIPSVDSGSRVTGDLYWIDRHPDEVLRRLDRYEGCSPEFPEPHLFKRRSAMVHLKDQTSITAWIYLYNRSVEGMNRIDSGDYLAWKSKE